MKLNIYNYLQNFEDKNLPNINGVLFEDGNRVSHVFDENNARNFLTYYKVDKKHGLYVKKFMDNNGENSSRFISELLNARILEKLGINSIRTYPFYKMSDTLVRNPFIRVASEDLRTIKGLDVTDDNSLLMQLPWKIFEKSKDTQTQTEFQDEWLLAMSSELKDYLASYMTEDCFDDLITLTIADLLLYIFDRFGDNKNLFFVKEIGCEKTQSVVPIDLESINFDTLKSYFFNAINKFMNEMYNEPIITTSVHGGCRSLTYTERLEHLKAKMLEGVFSPKQLELIKNILSLDIHNEIADILSKYNLDVDDSVFRIYNEMWERNSDILNL